LQSYRPHSLLKTTALVLENDRSGFEKRPQWFLKRKGIVSEKERLRFGKGRLSIVKVSTLKPM